MASNIACPNCNQFVDSHATRCEHCGVDLVIAAILAESLISQAGEPSPDLPMTPEVLVPRLGEYLVERKFISPKQLQQALDDQKKSTKSGKTILLGQALVQRGQIDRETLDKAVTEQILQLQAALKSSNDHLEQRVQERTSELERSLIKLTELNQLKYNFVSNISHELRTPLAHMVGYLDLISSESLGPLTASQIEAVNVLNKAYHRLQDLIDSLLLFSMASQGELSLRPLPLSLDKLVKSIVIQSQAKAKDRDITLEIDIPDDLPRIVADNEKLAWVLMQLMDNAIKFNHPGGKVEISARTSNQSVSVTVTDTGIGIEEEKLDEVFDAFHQLDSSASRKYGGTGIGLTLAQRIINAHGSSIDISSDINQGSRFRFTLPVTEVDVEERE
jgi:signal transduction histidine kinase